MNHQKHSIRFAAAVFLFVTICITTPVAFADDAAPDESGQWYQLFNGKDLTGWTVRSGTAKFEVVDGMIVGTTVPMSPNSFLCTDREYDEFELELEIHCDPGLNSGIQVRSQIAEEGTQVTITKNPKKPKTITLPKDRVYGHQVEIAKAESGRSGGVYDEARRFVFLDDLDGKPNAQAAFKDDQWNHIRIRCDGDRIQTWVNEVACADVRDKMDRKGIIGLQVHGNIAVTGRIIKKEYHKHQVRFRNIRIRELNDPTAGSATPFSGTAVKLPGRVEMEEFDRGGEGVAYHDTEELNKGSGKLNLSRGEDEATFRRSEGVDLSYTKKPHDRFAGDVTVSGEAEPPGALYLGWTKPGEWVRYSVDVQQAGRYVVSGHVSANNQNSALELHFGGNEKCIAPLPHTGSAHRWTTVGNLGSVELSSGLKMLTLKIGDIGGFNVDWLEFTLQPSTVDTSAVSESTKLADKRELTSGPIRKLADGFRFTEGPAWGGDGNWYFSDIPNKTFHRLSEDGKVELIRTGEQASNGIVVDADGQLIFCEVGGRRIVARSLDGKETTLADSCDGKPIGMTNDLWLSPAGDIYFTIPRTNKQRAKVVPPDAVNGTVCLVAADGESVRDVGVGLASPNGIVGSSDGKYLFVADPGSRKCWRFTIASDGSLKDQQVAADQGSDGLALDSLGNLYTTSQQGITVYSPDAEQIDTIKVPERPANMKFGGKDGRTLFITARTGIYAVPIRVRGDVVHTKKPEERNDE